ncbi:MAG: methionyl-tRNA formyltransferase [Clostridiales bacterium]|jgi:methionyl-tRNA formyltransferase|nr:methionyl-tRNA formyltransferase [Clostridiales bacterium]
MRIIFMGTPYFARTCLEGLVGASFARPHMQVIAAITQPDRPGGRGKRLQSPPVKEYALKMGIPVLQPEKIKSADSIAALQQLNADIFVVAAYGQILPQKILDMPKFGAINVHASLLPKYRGASPIQQAIADGETATGITIMQMDKGMDTGGMLLKREIAIDAHDTGGTLHDKLCALAPQALLDALELIESGKAYPEAQDNALATYAPLITKQMAKINWCKSPIEIVNLVRAYNPFPGAFTKIGGGQVKIWMAKIADMGPSFGRPAGEIILACPKDGIIVAAAGGAVRITELTPPNSKKMSAADFVRGHKIEAGEILT